MFCLNVSFSQKNQDQLCTTEEMSFKINKNSDLPKKIHFVVWYNGSTIRVLKDIRGWEVGGVYFGRLRLIRVNRFRSEKQISQFLTAPTTKHEIRPCLEVTNWPICKHDVLLSLAGFGRSFQQYILCFPKLCNNSKFKCDYLKVLTVQLVVLKLTSCHNRAKLDLEFDLGRMLRNVSVLFIWDEYNKFYLLILFNSERNTTGYGV